jgi:hypothetical protein
MFVYCTQTLGFSEGVAFRRLAAARLVRRFPALLDAIASGRIHLSNLVLLRRLFTRENLQELIAAAAGKSKREVEELVAKLAPKPDVPAAIRKLPEARGPASPQPPPPAQVPMSTGARSTPAVGETPPQVLPAPIPARVSGMMTTAAPSQQLQPLAESRYKIQLTVSAALKGKLEHARALMSHGNPSGDLTVVIERALDVLIVQLEKAKLGKTERPRRAPAPPPKDPAHVTQATRREVVSRDGLQCSFVSSNGERCQARSFLEFDHVHPRALGGSGDASNVRIFCRAHNRYAAEQVFGRAHIEEQIHLSQRCRPSDRPREPVVGGEALDVPT